jgi:hypothetical protein
MSDEQHALIIGPKNCEAITGWPWRHVRDYARKLGLPVLTLGRKHGVEARVFMSAIAGDQRAAPQDTDENR